jgi:hypothetical protein
MDADSIIGDITFVTKKWTRQRKSEERHANARRRRAQVFTRSRYTIRDAAWEVMEAAYRQVSGNGTLPAPARQLMYAARPKIQELTGEALDDKYFTQTLLPDFMNEHHAQTAGWDVVLDARGHFLEPHTGREVPLGTLEVRCYLRGSRREAPRRVRGLFPTHGPKNRFGAVLFIEKEGFLPVFRRVQLAERFDLAIMSTKGMSVVAARMLVDRLCGARGIPLFVLHDFDKSGFSILGGLRRDNRRYCYRHDPRVIDLGLRLEDVDSNGLEPEGVYIADTPKARDNLRRNGATPQEIEFLLGGQRVELNAFPTARGVVQFIEAKLRRHGVKKVVPQPDVLSETYAEAFVHEVIRAAIPGLREEALRRLGEDVPADLEARVTRLLRKKDYRHEPWDRIVAHLARKAAKDDGGPADSPR